jgi:hypothetical protein
MPSIFNPSGVKKHTSERVVQNGYTYSFPDAYSGRFEFFKNRPIEIVTEESDRPGAADSDSVVPEPPLHLPGDEPEAKARAGFSFWRRR